MAAGSDSGVMVAQVCQSAGRTDTGYVRHHNEDAILMRDDLGLWVVADGMGGHTAGDYASGLIVQRLDELPPPGNLADFADRVEDTLVQVNADLRHESAARGADVIGSTVVVLLHDAEMMLCGWVGDSRAYCFADNALRQITRDHVYGSGGDVTHLGAASPAPGAAALTRAVGAEDQLFVDWVVAENRPGVQFLLCSDGINKEMSDAEIAEVFRRDVDAETLVEKLFEVTFARGARDNVSAVVARLG